MARTKRPIRQASNVRIVKRDTSGHIASLVSSDQVREQGDHVRHVRGTPTPGTYLGGDLSFQTGGLRPGMQYVRSKPKKGERIPVHVVVVSYNRPDHCRRLLQDLVVEAATHDLSVHVFDDKSTEDYGDVQELLSAKNWHYTVADQNHGKQGFWRWVKQIYGTLEANKKPYVILLPDDVRLCRDFIARAVSFWRAIKDPRKIALTLQADSRLGRSNWTGITPKQQGDVWHTGWGDGAILCTPEYFKALGHSCPAVPADRWAQTPLLGSGVGQVLSTELHRQGRSMWCTHQSLLVHVGIGSQMNPEERKKNPLRSERFIDGPAMAASLEAAERVTISMASIPSRMPLLPRVIDRLYWQCDELRVYLNQYRSVPDTLVRRRIRIARSQQHKDRGDAGKFFWVDSTKGYILTCDDDILYPHDYVATLTAAVERYGRKAIVGVHGAIIEEQPRDYYNSRSVLHCKYDQATDRAVHVLGTGTTCFHASTIRVRPQDFKVPNMADIWLAVIARSQRVPMACIAHQGGWMEFFDDPQGIEIYKRYAGRDKKQGEVVRSLAPWPALPKRPRIR